MNHSTIDIRFEGNKFYPSKLNQKLNLPIEVLAEYGEISSNGRYKGQPSPYGMGLLEISLSEKQNNINELFREYCIKLLEWKDDLKEYGVEEIIIDIANARDFPMDLSLSNDILHSLSLINARVEFHSINEEVEPENKTESLKNRNQFFKRDRLYQKVLSSLKKHPFINKADAIPYFIYFYSTKNAESIDENLSKFEDFYKEAVKQ
jgi:hypothetical protein